MKKCKYCGLEFTPKSKVNKFCSRRCQKNSYYRRKPKGDIDYSLSKTQSGLVRLEDRELSSTQLWYIAEDVARGEPIDAAAAVFGWIGEKGFALFMSKLKKKEPEFERYLEFAIRQRMKRTRCG